MKKLILYHILLFTISLSSCRKDKNETLEFDTQTAFDNSLADGLFNDVNNIANQALSGSISTYRVGVSNEETLLSACATVTLIPDSSGSGGTATVDFGNDPCRCRDNRYRKGIISVRYTGAYRDSGTVITTTFNDYYVGSDSLTLYKVEGSKTVTNKGRNSANHIWFTINVMNARITNPSSSVMTWNSSRQREWIDGESTTGTWSDDSYSITGSASGTNFSGNAFTVNITSPLLFSLDCAYIKQGVFDLTPSGKPTRTFNYGNGTCDQFASVTVNGRTFNIVLR